MVLPASRFLPGWLRPLPPIVRRKRRQYWWSFCALPVSGWHVQQILKIAAEHRRCRTGAICILHFDVAFFRDFDLSRFRVSRPIPLSAPRQGDAGPDPPCALGRTSHLLLGLAGAAASGDRLYRAHHFLGSADHQAMVAKIEAVTERDWVEALCRIRSFSEYMLYGYFVRNDGRFAGGHTISPRTPCISYWDPPKLGKTISIGCWARRMNRTSHFLWRRFRERRCKASHRHRRNGDSVGRVAAKEPEALDALC